MLLKQMDMILVRLVIDIMGLWTNFPSPLSMSTLEYVEIPQLWGSKGYLPDSSNYH